MCLVGNIGEALLLCVGIGRCRFNDVGYGKDWERTLWIGKKGMRLFVGNLFD